MTNQVCSTSGYASLVVGKSLWVPMRASRNTVATSASGGTEGIGSGAGASAAAWTGDETGPAATSNGCDPGDSATSAAGAAAGQTGSVSPSLTQRHSMQ